MPNAAFSSLRYQITSGDIPENKAKDFVYDISNINQIYTHSKSAMRRLGSPDWFFSINNTGVDEYGDPIDYGDPVVYGGAGGGDFELIVTNNESFEICVTFDKLQILF